MQVRLNRRGLRHEAVMPGLWRVAGATLGAAVAYSMVEPHLLAVRKFDVALQQLPPEVEGLRIAQLSDLHCSAISTPRLVGRAVDLCNAESPDVIVMTGDYVSRRNSYANLSLARVWARPVMDYAQQMAEEVARLTAHLGVFAVPGNHDHSRQRFDAIEQLLHHAGVTTLVNSSANIRGVLPLVGLDDLRAGRPAVAPACRDVPAHQPHVILSHNPRLGLLLGGRNCLVLAGHTHGGQVHLPLTSFRRRPKDMAGTAWHQGWYRLGPAQMYVSSGVGSVHFPMRFRCPPEITVFTLRRL